MRVSFVKSTAPFAVAMFSARVFAENIEVRSTCGDHCADDLKYCGARPAHDEVQKKISGGGSNLSRC